MGVEADSLETVIHTHSSGQKRAHEFSSSKVIVNQSI